LKKKANPLTSVVRRYTEHEVGRAAASLTYYILFALFPFLMIICATVSYSQILDMLSGRIATLIPMQVLEIVSSYIQHVEEHGVSHLLLLGALLMLWSVFRAIATLMSAMNKAWGISPASGNLGKMVLKQLGLTVFVTLCMFLLIAFLALNTRMIKFFTDPTPGEMMFIRLWGYVRYFLVFAVMYIIVSALFRHGPSRELTLGQVFPGVAFSLTCWIGLSMLFGWYASNVANYSNVYGPLGTIIVLLIWINLSSMSMLLGCEFNAIFDARRRLRRQSKEKNESKEQTD